MIPIPLKDDNPTSRPAIITVIFIIANVLIHLLRSTAGGAEFMNSSLVYGAIPYELINGKDMAPFAPWPLYMNILSSMFMHGSWTHLLGNMLFLWVFGNNIEDYLGSIRFVLFYVLAGVAAVYSHVLTDVSSTIPMIGASGAISGIMGAYILLYPKARVKSLIFIIFYVTFIDLPAFLVLGIWFIYQIVYAFLTANQGGGGTAWLAHIGGFIFGLIFIKIFRNKRKPPIKRYHSQNYRAYRR